MNAGGPGVNDTPSSTLLSLNVLSTIDLLNDTTVPGNYLPLVGYLPSAAAYDATQGKLFVTTLHGNPPRGEGGGVIVISTVTDRFLATVPVPFDPVAAVFDPGTDQLFVADYEEAAVTVISGSTDQVVATVPVGSYPSALAYDAATSQVFVAHDTAAGIVSVIADSNDTVVASIPVGGSPQGLVYDPGTAQVFVAETSADAVGVISDSNDTVVATIPVGKSPAGLAYDGATGVVFVANYDAGTVSFLSDSNDTVFETVAVGGDPLGMAYDPATAEVFVTDPDLENVTVLAVVNATTVATILVGTGAVGAVYGGPAGAVDVVDEDGDAVVVVSDATDTITTTFPMVLGPWGMAVDNGTRQLFVAEYFDDAVAVIDDANQSVVATVPVGGEPVGIAYDSGRGEVFVANSGSDNVSVISDATDSVVATIPVGSVPWGVAYDPVTGLVYVSLIEVGAGEVLEISDTTDAVVGEVSLGSTAAPGPIVFDSGRNELFVGDERFGYLSVISGATGRLVTSYPLNCTPTTLTYDPTAGELFVGCQDESEVLGVSDTNGSVLASVLVGEAGFTYDSLTFDPEDHAVFALTPTSRGNLFAISATTSTVVANASVGVEPFGVAYDPSAGLLYVANFGSGTVSVLPPPPLYTVTFSETGLPPTTPWSVALGGLTETTSSSTLTFARVEGTYTYSVNDSWYSVNPSSGTVSLAGSNRTVAIGFNPIPTVVLEVREHGLTKKAPWGISVGYPARNATATGPTLTVDVPTGLISYRFTAPTGYGVARVQGAGHPGETAANVTGPALFSVTFGPFETVTFNETGLAQEDSWTVALASPWAHGGPPNQTSTTLVGGGYPTGIAYDPLQGTVAVTNVLANTVGILPATGGPDLATVPVGEAPWGAIYDSGTGQFFVANHNSNNVSVISATTDRVVDSVAVGEGPGALVYDPTTGDVFAANYWTDNVSVISDRNDTVVATVPAGGEPAGLVYDPGTGEVFAVNQLSDNVSVISVASDTEVASIPLGAAGLLPSGAAYDPARSEIFVVSLFGNVSVISDSTDAVVATVPIPPATSAEYVYGYLNAIGVGFDPGTGDVFATSQVGAQATNVSVISDTNDTVVRTVRVAGFLAAATYDPASSDLLFPNVLAGTVTQISGASFAVSHSGFTSGTTMTFTLVKGGWSLDVTSNTDDRSVPHRALLTVPAHELVKQVVFQPPESTVTFREIGLPHGTLWGVNVTGPENLSGTSMSGAIKLRLDGGSYNFTVWNFSSLHPEPANGSFPVFPPGPLTVKIYYGIKATPGRPTSVALAALGVGTVPLLMYGGGRRAPDRPRGRHAP